MDATEGTRWGDAGSSPLEDIRRVLDEMMNMPSFYPDTFIMRRSWYLRMMRSTMTKRRWRRFRGRHKGMNRGR